MEIRKGDILLYKVDRNSFISKLVSATLKSEYTHTAMALSKDTLIEADNLKGVIVRPIDFNRDMLILRCQDASERQLEGICKEALNLVGTRYDYLWALGQAIQHLLKLNFSLSFNIVKFYSCTELIDHLYKLEGIDLFPENRDATPSLFLDSSALTVVDNNYTTIGRGSNIGADDTARLRKNE